MPDIYTVEIDGVEYDIEGDRPPTEAEARAAIGGTAPSQPTRATPLPAGATRGMLPNSTPEDNPRFAGIGNAGVRQMMQGYSDSARGLRQEAVDHPVRTAAEVALGAIPAAGPIIGRAAARAPGVIARGVAKHPTIVAMTAGGATGALSDTNNPLRGAAIGAGAGFMNAPALGRRAERFARRVSGSPAPQAPPTPASAPGPSAAQPTPASAPSPSQAPPSTPAEAMRREVMARDIDWRTVDAVPVDAIKRDVTRGGKIVEAGESRVGLAERIATLMKNPTPENMAEADRLSRALRQRMHINRQ